jgi:hypothetical protein
VIAKQLVFINKRKLSMGKFAMYLIGLVFFFVFGLASAQTLPVLRVSLLPDTGAGSLSATTADSDGDIRGLAANAAFRQQVTALNRKPAPAYSIIYADGSREIGLVANPYSSVAVNLVAGSLTRQGGNSNSFLNTSGADGYSNGDLIVEGRWVHGYVNGEYSRSEFIVTSIIVMPGSFWKTSRNHNIIQ